MLMIRVSMMRKMAVPGIMKVIKRGLFAGGNGKNRVNLRVKLMVGGTLLVPHTQEG